MATISPKNAQPPAPPDFFPDAVMGSAAVGWHARERTRFLCVVVSAQAVKTGLAQYSAAYASATDDYEKTEAEIGVEVYQAMSFAIADGSA